MADTTHGTTGAGAVRETAERGVDETKKAIRDSTDTARQQVKQAAELAREGAEQAQDIGRATVRSAAELQGQIAEIGQDQSRRGLESAARIVDIYREAGEGTVSDVQALFGAFSHIGRGMQQMQHAWLDTLEWSTERTPRRPQDLLRCNSPIEFAEAQRDLYRHGVAYMIHATATMLDVMGRTVAEASRSVEGRN